MYGYLHQLNFISAGVYLGILGKYVNPITGYSDYEISSSQEGQPWVFQNISTTLVSVSGVCWIHCQNMCLE